MNRQPDKLFKEAFENHQKQAPANAWSRIESGLNKKKYKPGWLSMAAALLLISGVSAIVWLTSARGDQASKIISQNQPVHDEVLSSPGIKEETPELTTDNNPQTETNQQMKVDPAPTVYSAVEKNKSLTKEKLITDTNEIKIQELTDDAPDKLIAAVPSDNLIHEAVEAVSPSEKLKIVLEASEVNEKYFDKKSLAQATDDNKKPSTLRKVLDKAYDLKHDQDPFGELRQMKNEILALNLQGDRKQQQNK